MADLLLREQERISALKQDVDACRPRLQLLHRAKEDALDQQVTRLQVIRKVLQTRRQEYLQARKRLDEERRKTQQFILHNPNRSLADEVADLRREYKEKLQEKHNFLNTCKEIVALRRRRDEDYDILLSDCNEYGFFLHQHGYTLRKNLALKLLLQTVVPVPSSVVALAGASSSEIEAKLLREQGDGNSDKKREQGAVEYLHGDKKITQYNRTLDDKDETYRNSIDNDKVLQKQENNTTSACSSTSTRPTTTSSDSCNRVVRKQSEATVLHKHAENTKETVQKMLARLQQLEEARDRAISQVDQLASKNLLVHPQEREALFLRMIEK
ncbi:unnamed protein product [Amoebophrya sp. A25]|nr:unnamed protein product [Amoebophrya sp. A25]|eukprot:GSA25T00022436001.1